MRLSRSPIIFARDRFGGFSANRAATLARRYSISLTWSAIISGSCYSLEDIDEDAEIEGQEAAEQCVDHGSAPQMKYQATHQTPKRAHSSANRKPTPIAIPPRGARSTLCGTG